MAERTGKLWPLYHNSINTYLVHFTSTKSNISDSRLYVFNACSQKPDILLITETLCCHKGNFFVIGGTAGGDKDNLRCCQWPPLVLSVTTNLAFIDHRPIGWKQIMFFLRFFPGI